MLLFHFHFMCFSLASLCFCSCDCDCIITLLIPHISVICDAAIAALSKQVKEQKAVMEKEEACSCRSVPNQKPQKKISEEEVELTLYIHLNRKSKRMILER